MRKGCEKPWKLIGRYGEEEVILLAHLLDVCVQGQSLAGNRCLRNSIQAPRIAAEPASPPLISMGLPSAANHRES